MSIEGCAMRAYQQREGFDERAENVPKSDSLKLHKLQTVDRPYGTQEIYVSENRQYRVCKAEVYDANANHPIAWLVITPITENTALHDWRTMQLFKNQLCGEDNYGVEIYPAESDCIDANNNFHLWVWLDGYKPPFGFRDRIVVDPAENKNVIFGTPQRPFAAKPKNTTSAVDAQRKIVKGSHAFMSKIEAKEVLKKREEKEKRRRK